MSHFEGRRELNGRVGDAAKVKCVCGRLAAFKCKRCLRFLCALHYALGPEVVEVAGCQSVEVFPVCLPVCSAPYWSNPGRTREWQTSERERR